MADLVNLRQARKAKARREKAQHAAANRIRFGQNKDIAQARRRETRRQAAKLDGHKLEKPPGGPCAPETPEDGGQEDRS